MGDGAIFTGIVAAAAELLEVAADRYVVGRCVV